MVRIWLAVLLCSAFIGGDIAFADEWKATKGGKLSSGKLIAKAPNGLPDGHVSRGAPGGNIKAAWYTKPTKRYGHGILGDAIEGGELTVRNAKGNLLTYTLPDDQVFEDRTPRVLDLDGFGKTHVVTILTHARKGGSIAVFGIAKNKLTLLAQTPYIGRSNRWLNIAGIDDFDGDGSTQIAEVRTPHIGGTLRFWTWKKGRLKLTASAYGFSNHFIGSREQELSAVEDFDGDGVSDIAVPSANRKSLRLMKFTGKAQGKKTLIELANILLPGRINRAIRSRVKNGKVEIFVGLDNRSVWTVHQ